MAGHLFGGTAAAAAAATTATVLQATSPGSNASGVASEQTSADGIGGWSSDGTELLLLLTAFSPLHKNTDGRPVTVQVSFAKPQSWAGASGHEGRGAVLNRSTSTFDRIWLDGKDNGWLANASDPNVYVCAPRPTVRARCTPISVLCVASLTVLAPIACALALLCMPTGTHSRTLSSAC